MIDDGQSRPVTTTCEMFCNEPVGPDGEPGTEELRARCARCRVVQRHLTHEVLPTIRRYGSYSPPGSNVVITATWGLGAPLDEWLAEHFGTCQVSAAGVSTTPTSEH